MITRERVIEASPEQVWEVLSNGWLYPTWVVGASRMRAVDATWPAVGARLHHSVGTWPALIDDTTEVLEADPCARLVLQARGWPVGQAQVVLTLEPDGAGTRVTITEDATAGPGRLVPEPVRNAGLAPRNDETLRRLAYVAEGRTR